MQKITFMKNYTILVLFAFTLFFWNCKSSKIPTYKNTYRIGFYNVENLFDTLDHPIKPDEEFTPGSEKKWNTERYFKKLNDLAKVVDGMEYPAILGVCEVENELVLNDLTQKTSLNKYNYGVVHRESPDYRGIDNALIYQKKLFNVLSTDVITINFPKSVIGEDDYVTRDILHVVGTFKGKTKLHIFVNHFPSRYGGREQSEPKRLYVAQQLKNAVDKIFATDSKANILIMGDMNDETDNNSIAKTLQAFPELTDAKNPTLVNCSAQLDQAGKGTYNFRGNWNMLDQIIVSSPMLDKKSKVGIGKFVIYQDKWMMYENKKYGMTPSRTYGGPKYFGGISDHLPVFIEVMTE